MKKRKHDVFFQTALFFIEIPSLKQRKVDYRVDVCKSLVYFLSLSLVEAKIIWYFGSFPYAFNWNKNDDFLCKFGLGKR